MNTVAFHTLGCKVNQYESESMIELFEKAGYTVVTSNEIADVYVINTCTVTNMSDRKSRQFINRVKKLNPKSIIGVVGCYSQVSPEEVASINGVDVIIGTTEREKIVELCEEAKEDNIKFNIVRDIKSYKKYDNINIEDVKSKTRAYIKIQDGCSQFCSYCIIPHARGPIRSRDINDIISEAKNLGELGFKEVVLTGIHVASYGKDFGKLELSDVIKEIGEIQGIDRIRLSSLEPTIIDDKFMKTLLSVGKVCDHFHLSLQSGSNSILKRMNRKYTRELFLEKVNIIRKYMPNAGITTDIIVGFPGETDFEFNETIEFVEKVKFSKIHVFKYSPRTGTPAAKFPNQVHGKIKNSRSRKLINIGEKLANDFNEKFVGQKVDVLYEEINHKENCYEGYTSNYIRVKTKHDKDIIEQIIETNIIQSKNGFIIGQI